MDPLCKKSNVLINTDSTGRKYVEICHLNSVQKNNQPTMARPKTDQNQSRFYQSNCERECPVLAIQMLLSRLPETAEYLFYKPLKNWQSSEFWYNTSLVIGSQTLGNMMKKISQNAKLSKVYTAHMHSSNSCHGNVQQWSIGRRYPVHYRS